MSVERIFISPERGAPQIARTSVTVKAGEGIVGDRNFGKSSYSGQNLTLVEAEEIESFCELYGRAADLSLTRRNLVVRGVHLNNLVGVKFRVGSVLLYGVELCEPCSILGSVLASESLSAAAAVKHWVRRGGLRVDVLASGEIKLGEQVEVAA